MKVGFLLAAVVFSHSVVSAEPVYVLPPEELGVTVQTLNANSFIKEANRYAEAASLKANRPSGDFELRIWRRDVMFGGGVGYVLRDGRVHIFDIMRRDNRYTAKSISTRKVAFSQALVAAARDVSLLAGNEYSCGIMDGESVLIEASIEGKSYQLWAGNPVSCQDKYSKRIASLLNLVHREAHPHEP